MSRSGVAAAFVLLLSTTVLVAASGARPAGRFDDYERGRGLRVVATAPRAVEQLDPIDPLRAGWQQFDERYGGRRKVFLDERTGMPTLVTGRPIDWSGSSGTPVGSLVELEDLALQFLHANRTLLGGQKPWLVLDTEASADLGDGRWQLVFRQEVDGTRVENARLDFHIDRGGLTLFGASNWAPPTTDGLPTIDADQARSLLDDYLDGAAAGLDTTGEPRLVIRAEDADPGPGRSRRWTGVRGAGLVHALIWRVELRDPDGPALWTGEIDAHDGTIRAFYDGAHYAGIRGGVFPEQPDGDCSTGGCELDGFPMPYADWTESGQTESIADAYGNFDCSDPDATFETRLEGRYVTVVDTCGAISEVAGCDGTLQLGLKTGENCDIGPFGSPGNTAAARSSYYHVNRVAEAARFYTPGIAWLDGKIDLNTNWNGTCNASYGGGAIYVYRHGSICANSGEIQGIAVHEWGHGLDENDGGGWDETSEAYGDMVSLFASRQSCFGPGLFIDGRVCSGYGDACLTCTGFRDHDWTARTAGTPATPQLFVADNCGSGGGPCGGEVHCETYPIVESMFDLATRDLPAAGVDVDTAWQLVERLWYSTRQSSGGAIYTCALPDSDSCAASSWYQRLRGADDDDGDPSNGTPHAAELYAAFARHNIACGAVDAPENQSTSSCPALVAPQLTLSAGPGRTELTWSAVAGADAYQVYRGDLGCGRQQIPVATLPAGVTSWLDGVGDPDVIRYYRIEAIGSNPVCRSPVSSCEAGPDGPRLQKQGHRLIDNGVNGNDSGLLDPGETVSIPVSLFNGGTADATGVTGRLRMVDPLQGRVVEPVADWPDLPVGADAESDLPYFELTLFESGVACAETVGLELEMDADEMTTRTRRFEFTLGETDREYERSDNVAISRFSTDPVLSTFELSDDTIIGDLDVSVSITHNSPGTLIVELSSPAGTTVRLHDSSGGSGGIFTRYDLLTQPDGPGAMADFEGESLAGTWTLSAQNTTFGVGTGSVGNWTLHVSSAGAFDCDPLVCAEPPPLEAPDNLLVDKLVDGGDGSVDLSFSWDAVAGVAGYHVLLSTAAAFDQQVDLIARTAGATTATVDNGVPITPTLSYFQVRAVNGCNEESP